MWAAVVLDVADGTRHVVRLTCHAVVDATCSIGGADDWLDGHAPPSFPPGTTFG